MVDDPGERFEELARRAEARAAAHLEIDSLLAPVAAALDGVDPSTVDYVVIHVHRATRLSELLRLVEPQARASRIDGVPVTTYDGILLVASAYVPDEAAACRAEAIVGMVAGTVVTHGDRGPGVVTLLGPVGSPVRVGVPTWGGRR